MVSPNLLVSYETARKKIGQLPSLPPRPTATKIRALYNRLREVLAKIPSYQLPNHGYQDMVDQAEIYALTGETAWIDFADLGFRRQANGSLDPVAQRNAEAIFNVAIMVYTFQ